MGGSKKPKPYRYFGIPLLCKHQGQISCQMIQSTISSLYGLWKEREVASTKEGGSEPKCNDSCFGMAALSIYSRGRLW